MCLICCRMVKTQFLAHCGSQLILARQSFDCFGALAALSSLRMATATREPAPMGERQG